MTLQRADDPGDRIAAAEAIYPLLTAAVRHQPRDISLTAASTLARMERTRAADHQGSAAAENLSTDGRWR